MSVSSSPIVLASAQLKIDGSGTGRDFNALLRHWCQRASKAGASLLVLPEYSWLALSGLKNLPSKKSEFKAVRDRYLETVGANAKEFKLSILAGTIIWELGRDWGSAAALFDSDGKIVCRQFKIHLNRIDRALGFRAGSKVELMEGPFGPMSVLIGGDTRIPELARSARFRGAELLLQPAAMLAHADEEPFPTISIRAMENQVPAVASHLVGTNFGCSFSGRSRIFTLPTQTDKGDGLVACSRSGDTNALVVGTLRPDGIARERDKMDYMLEFNTAFAGHYLTGAKFASVRISPAPSKSTVRASAVQMNLEFFHDPEPFTEKIERFFIKAKKDKADLIVFPEDTGTLLLGIYLHPMGLFTAFRKGYEEFAKLLNRESGLREYLFSELSSRSHEFFHETFSTLTHKYGINAVTGTTYIPESKGIFNTAYVYDRRGRMLGTQKKIHLHYVEREWKLDRSDRVRVFDLDVGRVGVSICMDNHFPEVARALRLEGAQIIADCSAYPDRYLPAFARSGLWSRVQDNGVFGIESVMVGDIFPRWRLRGRSSVCAPSSITPDHSGILALSRNSTGEALVTAELDFTKLNKWLETDDPLKKISSEFLASSLGWMYEKPGKK